MFWGLSNCRNRTIALCLRISVVVIKLTKSILGRQIESMLDYHRILEMFMQVVHIFTYPRCLLFSSMLQSQRAWLSQLREFGRTLDIDLNINMIKSETSLVPNKTNNTCNWPRWFTLHHIYMNTCTYIFTYLSTYTYIFSFRENNNNKVVKNPRVILICFVLL